MDFEGTGYASDGGKIISISYILYDLQEEKIILRFSSIVNPKIKVDQHILTLTGITQEAIDKAPTIDVIASSIKELFEKYTIYFYNANADLQYLINEKIFFTEQCEFLKTLFPSIVDNEAKRSERLELYKDGYSCAIDMFYDIEADYIEEYCTGKDWNNANETQRCWNIANRVTDFLDDAYFKNAFFNFVQLTDKNNKTFTPYKFDCVFETIRDDWELLNSWNEKYNDDERFDNLKLYTLTSKIYESITGSTLQNFSHSALFDCEMTLFLLLIIRKKEKNAIKIFEK
jgi:hypothetical protein